MMNLVLNFEYLVLQPSFEIWGTFKVLDLILMLAEKNQNKHSKFDIKFVIRHPV